MAKFVRYDGKVVTCHPKNVGKTFTLDELKEYVDGWIECVPLSKSEVMVINEEGKLLNLPYNGIATNIFHNAGGDRLDYIAGNALICEINNEID